VNAKKTKETIEVVKISPRAAITMLINGLLPEADAQKFRPATVTVDMLVKLLRNTEVNHNRTVSLRHVNTLARDMSSGKWKFTGEPIQVDTDGYVRNGQHRLLAVVASGVTLEFVVIRNVSPESQLVMDIGRTRTARDQATMSNVRNASTVTAAAKLLLNWRDGRIMSSIYQPSIAEVLDIIAEFHDDFQDAANITMRVRSHLRRAPGSVIAAVHIEAGLIDPNARDEFFESLITGVNLNEDDPIYALRGTIMRYDGARHRQAAQLYQVIRTWNAWRKNETLRYLRVPKTLTSESFPNLV
jgi:hypothetical protein